MLSTEDLNQIKTLMESVVEQKLRETLHKELQKELQKEIGPIKKSLRKIQKDLDTTIDYFDKGYLNHKKRIKTVESHLQIFNPL